MPLKIIVIFFGLIFAPDLVADALHRAGAFTETPHESLANLLRIAIPAFVVFAVCIIVSKPKKPQ